MDPRLQSIHLDAAPRREDFRRARAMLQGAAGSHTLAGDLRPALQQQDMQALTCVPDNPISYQPAGDAAVAWLLDRGQPIALKVGLNSIGRLPDNDIVIDDACVSRRHCAILVHSDLTCELHDIASKNGTTINGVKLSRPTRLHEGDSICLCERRLTFLQNLKAATQNPPSRAARVEVNDVTMVN